MTLWPIFLAIFAARTPTRQPRLLRRVGDALFVLEPADVADGIVGDRELGVRILLRVLLHRRAEQEAGGDDDLRAVLTTAVL